MATVRLHNDHASNIDDSSDETVVMTYLYINKYKRFMSQSEMDDPLDPYVCPPLILLSLSPLASDLKTRP